MARRSVRGHDGRQWHPTVRADFWRGEYVGPPTLGHDQNLPVIRDDRPPRERPAPISDTDFLDPNGNLNMDRVRQWQDAQPAWVQAQIADENYPSFAHYRAHARQLNRMRGTVEVTDADIAAMSLERFDALFDANGNPRDGVVYRPTAAMDPRSLSTSNVGTSYISSNTMPAAPRSNPDFDDSPEMDVPFSEVSEAWRQENE